MPQNDIFICFVVASLGIAAAVLRNILSIACFSLYVTYIVFLLIHRLFLHDLSKVPGPRLAAATYLYEFYYNVLKRPGGQYMWKLEELHKQYGPILRISPEEVQINDPEFFRTVYAGGTEKRHRWDRGGSTATSAGAMSSALSHDLHRIRRSSLVNFFSKGAILRLESRIQNRIASLCQLLERANKSGEVINVTEITSKLTLGIITEYGKFSSLTQHRVYSYTDVLSDSIWNCLGHGGRRIYSRYPNGL